MPRAIALFTGSLDSLLAVCTMQRQGWQIEALHVRTLFRCGHGDPVATAGVLGIPLVQAAVANDYLDIVRHPRFGYGRGANPCIDCRLYVCRVARQRMEQTQADLVITGEVLGQRSMGQKRRDLELIAVHSGLGDRLLRPLSARLLAPTAAERAGLVDRDKLHAICGSGRADLLRLAQAFDIGGLPGPGAGCALAEPIMTARVSDLIRQSRRAERWEYELLAMGRHYRLDAQAKLVVGRNAAENAAIEALVAPLATRCSSLVELAHGPGPRAVLVGEASPERLCQAATILGSRKGAAGWPLELDVRCGGVSQLVVIDRPAAESPDPL